MNLDTFFTLEGDIREIFIRLAINVVVLYILMNFVYFPFNGKRKLYFTYFMMGIMIFIISAFLGMVNIQMGFALGLFAIFSIIRYRTPPIEIKDITYLFLVIGIAVVNALVHFKVFWRGILLSNIIILVSAYLLERYKPKKKVLRKQLVYTPMDFSIISDTDKLKTEIEGMLNMEILKVTVEKINMTKNELTVIIYYKPKNNPDGLNSINSKIIYTK
ncbi:MAG: DUF4956 domain-containing protein [Chlorobi bacterium]|nr:DUF4956 domain-containing protein [Chlorobiota bacterium]